MGRRKEEDPYNTASFIYTPHMVNFENGNQSFNAAAYGDGVYVALGNNGLITSSKDGTD